MTRYRDIDYSNLGWVRKELNSTLQEVSQALEAYVAEPADSAQLRFCVTYLHQVRAILQMLELYGAGMLAEEMECLAQALVDDAVAQRQEAYEILVRAILQLTDYLERIEHGSRDLPILLLPLLNDLRAMRGANLLSENAFFSPDLGKQPTQIQHIWSLEYDAESKARARQLRPVYQLALLGWLRKRGTDNLRRLGEVLRRLESSASVANAATLWWVAGGVVEALYLQALEPSVSVNMLLGHLDRQIKRLSDVGEQVFQSDPANDLLKNLLYYVAQAKSLGERVVQIQQIYNLRILMPRADELDRAREAMAGPTQAMLESVAVAIKEDLTGVKDKLDIIARGDGASTNDASSILAILRRVADTLGMLGLGLARKVVLDQVGFLQHRAESSGSIDEQVLIEAASALLFVEAEVDDLLTPGSRRTATSGGIDDAVADDSLLEAEFNRVLVLVVKEALADLIRAKDIIIDYSVAPEFHERLQDIPALLNGLRGAFQMAGMPVGADIIAGVLQFLRADVIDPARHLSRAHFDELAETISSLEYYLEGVRDRHAQPESALDRANAALLRLRELPATSDSPEIPSYEANTAATQADEEEFLAAFPFLADREATDKVGGEPIELIEIPALGAVDDLSAEPVSDLEPYPWLNDTADPEILDVFYEESDEVYAALESDLVTLRADYSNVDALTNVRRAFHTLKGSGRLAGSPMVGEFYWVCEQVLNQALGGTITPDNALVDFIERSTRALPELIERLRSGKTPNIDPMAFIDRSETRYNLPRSAARNGSGGKRNAATAANKAGGSDDEDPEPAHGEREKDSDDALDSQDLEGLGDDFYIAFRADASVHIADLKAFVELAEASPTSISVSPAVVQSIGALLTIAVDASVTPISRLAAPLKQHLSYLELSQTAIEANALNVVGECVALFEAMLAAPDTREPDILGFNDLLARVQHIVGALAADTPENTKQSVITESVAKPIVDNDLVTLFLEEADETVGFLESSIQDWRADPAQEEVFHGLQRALHTLKGGARMAGFPAVADLSHAMETFLLNVKSSIASNDVALFDEFQAALDKLVEMLEQAAKGEAQQIPTAIISRLGSFAGASQGGANSTQTGDALVPNNESGAIDVDTELAQVFLEESVETLVGTETAIQRWKSHPTDVGPSAELQRLLHTLKGGARMAGFVPIGNLAHQLESLVAACSQQGAEVSAVIFELLDSCYDHLLEMLERARLGKPLGSVADLVEQIGLTRDDIVKPQPINTASTGVGAVDASARNAPTEADRKVKSRLQHDIVRVPSELLDRLVNYAGEISIYRARLGQQIGGMGFNLVELDQTVARLRDQLRKLEMEAEAQILSHNDGNYSAAREGFDALEFDRFSQLQQLSRALAESVGDLVSIQSLLASLSRESEVLLGQQARLNTELQEGLMRTRMVPFSSLVPRLRRIVRQTAHELSKKAELEVIGGDGEMDRAVLERVTAPLEHMLRNALAHGVESPMERRRAGKPEIGAVFVRLSRESSEVVIAVGDDGAGMNIEAIRQKAMQRGLIRGETRLSDHEVIQFVLESGFSTAQQVTQIAGRGVGMDVVNSEIKQMGGSLTISSTPGKGTTFIAHLPFTLALNQALLVYAGPELYAIPLAAIEGVVRVTQEELSYIESKGGGEYAYAGQSYHVLSLSYLLGLGEPETLAPLKRIPVLLIQAGDNKIAMRVDALVGSREIVVKSVGPQLSTISGLMGATILGDGSVVLILDVVALARIGLAIKQEGPNTTNAPRRVDLGGKIRVMVVDDSITVRKVTTRFLERNNMAVVTAKDGVDAIARLNEDIPDVMLLDIEMPRMDGFELATHVRNDPKLRHLPIIMITSRSGDKHRQRAFDIGVDRYLSKPYQESELLENIVSVLSEVSAHG